MDQLWAPWRLAYVANPKPPAEHDPCFLCRGLAEADDRANLLAFRTELSVVYLNRFPYNNGHFLVAPKAHKSQLEDLTEAEILDTQQTLIRLVGRLKATMKPDGFNVGLNIGRTAGAGVPGHLHWHIVPRWQGDTNFMPLFTETRVIVQSLDALYELLTKEGQAANG